MNGSVNHVHYNVGKQTAEVQTLVADGKLTGPTFIGQGLSRGCGSDCYGFYITGMKDLGKKVIWGITEAGSVMHTCWEDGTMDCSIDMNTAKPTMWIVQSGWWKNKKTGDKLGPKWYYCDEFGAKFNGQKARFGWNGAYAYRDPSF